MLLARYLISFAAIAIGGTGILLGLLLAMVLATGKPPLEFSSRNGDDRVITLSPKDGAPYTSYLSKLTIGTFGGGATVLLLGWLSIRRLGR